MLVLRCTQKILERLGGPTCAEGDASTGRLGDWFANLLIIRREQLVLAVSAVTLLPVLLPAAPLKTLPARLPQAVEETLLGVMVARRAGLTRDQVLNAQDQEEITAALAARKKAALERMARGRA